jgi:hypothetical protein
MSDKVIANLIPPQPILQQQKSSRLVTNPFIPNEQKEQELQVVQEEANDIIKVAYQQNQTSSIQNQSLGQININISQSVIGFLDDCFNKPDDIPWKHYLPMITQKEQRYTYIGILLIFISIFFLIVKQ